MGVSLDAYRARIGLHHLRVSGNNVLCRYCYIGTSVVQRLLLQYNFLCSGMFLLVVYIISILLLLSGDIELNPGPSAVRNRTRYFSYCHANMRSIKRCPDKLDHIRAEFIGIYDVITISETWLTPNDNLDQYGRPLYKLDGYHDPVRRDRIGRPGGGVLAWVSQHLTYKRMLNLESADIELMAVEVRSQNNKVLFLVVYRTNEQLNFWENLQNCYDRSVLAGYNYIILIGDLNADPATAHGDRLLSFVENNNLTKHVNESTNITGGSQSELDQIITNCTRVYQNNRGFTIKTRSDHN